MSQASKKSTVVNLEPRDTIKQAAAEVVALLRGDETYAVPRYFKIGEKLSVIRKAVESPDCGVPGDNPDARYSVAVQHVLEGCHQRVGDTPSQQTLWNHRKLYETFRTRQREIFKAELSLRKLLAAAAQPDPDAALDRLLAGLPAKEDTPSDDTDDEASDITTAATDGAQSTFYADGAGFRNLLLKLPDMDPSDQVKALEAFCGTTASGVVVSIGAGGSLTVSERPVKNPARRYAKFKMMIQIVEAADDKRLEVKKGRR